MRLLLALNRFRIARTRDLVTLCFREIRADTAAVRLRKLFDAGFIDVRSSVPGSENLYALGKRGRQHIEECGLRVGPVPRGGIEHHTSIVTAWVSFATVGESLIVRRALPDWELRETGAAATWPVIPDLLLAVECDRREAIVAVEVDLGTERLSELRSKARRYGELASAILNDDLVLVVAAPSPVRAGRIRPILDAEFTGRSAVCEASRVIPEVALAAIQASEAPLARSPYGKGRFPELTVDAASATEESRGRH